jgi:hypothetical protein
MHRVCGDLDQREAPGVRSVRRCMRKYFIKTERRVFGNEEVECSCGEGEHEETESGNNHELDHAEPAYNFFRGWHRGLGNGVHVGCSFRGLCGDELADRSDPASAPALPLLRHGEPQAGVRGEAWRRPHRRARGCGHGARWELARHHARRLGEEGVEQWHRAQLETCWRISMWIGARSPWGDSRGRSCAGVAECHRG